MNTIHIFQIRLFVYKPVCHVCEQINLILINRASSPHVCSSSVCIIACRTVCRGAFMWCAFCLSTLTMNYLCPGLSYFVYAFLLFLSRCLSEWPLLCMSVVLLYCLLFDCDWCVCVYVCRVAFVCLPWCP